jgi:hypothetical protein
MGELSDLLTGVLADLTRPLETTRGVASVTLTLLGVVLLIAASLMRTMVRLRAITAMSNLFLLAGAVTAPHGALVVLYLVLFPVNCLRLAEIVRVTRHVEEAVQRKDLSGIWLKPYMKAKRLSAGTVIFHRGDPADALFLLVKGELEWVEIGTRQPRGELFGEISFFAPDRTRTLTGRCVTDCLVMKIRGDAFKEMYFTNPKFAFHVSELIAERLITDVRQLQHKLDTMPAPLEEPRQVA